MITAVIYKNSEDRIFGFRISGHAGFDRYGRDIICAAVSALSINTINSIEKFTDDRFTAEQSDGNLKFKLVTDKAPETQLLLKSFILGLESIRDTYGDRYIRIIIRTREV
ncbi:MAG: ribosomal-processing cysteine protease Prp [Lachnospiraceae bacterium]